MDQHISEERLTAFVDMAVSLGFGILFSTFITLVLVPNLYLIIKDIKGLFSSSKKSPGSEINPVYVT